jgi:membrane protein
MLRPPPTSPAGFLHRFHHLVHDRIWRHDALLAHGLRGWWYALLRMLCITVQGSVKNKIPSQAAALSYSSLISLGPIVSLAIIISSFFVQKNDTDFATQMLQSVIQYIAPPVHEFSKHEEETYDENEAPVTDDEGVLTATDGTALQPSAPNGANSSTPAATAPADAAAPAHPAAFNPAIVRVLDQMIHSAKSGKVGALGLALLVFIGIQLIITIENTFNSIWGVRRGRGLMHRIVMYWAIISLGTLVAFTAGTLFSAATLARFFVNLPAGLQFMKMFGLLPHALSFVLVSLLLATFYRFIPNTLVRWSPALAGGVTATVFLTLNNYLSFLYVNKVISSESLYGSIGIFPVLMFGLFIFWLLILLGGQVTFAVQNANYLTDERLWMQVSPRVRRLLSLASFLQVARAFVRKLDGPTAADLVDGLRVPGNILNECINRLCDLKLLSTVETMGEHEELVLRYQPGRDLGHLTLGDFHRELDELGNSDGADVLHATDPVVQEYLEAVAHFEKSAGLNRTFSELVGEGEIIAPLPAPPPAGPSSVKTAASA